MTDERNPADLAETLNEAQRLEDELFDAIRNRSGVNTRNAAQSMYENQLLQAWDMLTEAEREAIRSRLPGV